MDENFTARFKADISDLKKNITIATEKMKEINSEYKAAAAAAELAGKKQEVLAAKAKQLGDTIGVLEGKLKNYAQQLKKTEDYLEQMRKEEERLQKELDQSKKEYGDTSKEAKAYAAQLEKCRKAINSAETNVTKLKTAMNNTEAEISQSKKALKDLGDAGKNAGTKLADLSGNLTSINTAMSGLQNVVDGLTNKLLNLAANGLRAVANGMKEVVVASFQTGSAFEKSMSTAQATMMADDAAMEPLEALAQELGATTVKSAKDVADAYNYMAQAGWKTEEMLAATADMINLSIASGEDMALVTDIVTDALTAFGMQASDASRLCDILAAAAAASNTNVEKMGESFKYAAPLAGAMGYSAEDTALALGLMANAGIKATQAGTSLRKIFSQTLNQTEGIQLGSVTVDTVNADGSMRALKDVLDDLRAAMNGLSDSDMAEVTGDIQKAAEELSVALTDENGALKSTAQLAADVAEAMDGLSASEQIAFADANAGKTAMAGLLSILNASEESYNDLSDAIYNSAGACEEMAAIAGDNLAGSFKGLESRLESVKLAFYDKLQMPVRRVVDSVAQQFGKMAQSMDKGSMAPALTRISDAISRLGDKIVPIVEANGPQLLSLFNSLADAVVGVVDALPGLIERCLPDLITQTTSLLDKLPGLIEDKLPKVIDGIAWLIEHGGQLVETLIGVKVALTGIQAVSGVLSIVSTVAKLFGAGGGLAKAGTAVAGLFGAGGALAGVGTAITGALSTVGTALAGVGTAIVGALGWPVTLALAIGAALAGVFTLLYKKCDGFREWVNGVGEKIKSFFGETFQGIRETFSGLSFGGIGEKFSSVVEKMKTKAGELKEKVSGRFKETEDSGASLAERIKGISFDDVAYKAGEVAGTVVSFFANLPERIKVSFTKIISDINAWAAKAKETLSTKVQDIIENTVTFFSELPSKVAAKFTEARDKLAAAIEEWKTKGAQKIREVVDAIVSGVRELPSKMLQAGRDAIQGLKNGLVESWNNLKEWGSSLADNFLAGFRSKMEISSPSRAMKRLARFIPEGAKEGVIENTKVAVAAIRTMADKMMAGFDTQGLSNKIQAVKGGIVNTAGTFSRGVETSKVENNNTTNTSTKNVTYAPVFHYNKPLNAKETYRQNKNMLNNILGVT